MAQGVEHGLWIAALHIAATTTEHEQGVTGDQVIAQVVTSGTWCVAWGVQHVYTGAAELDGVAAVMKVRADERVSPETGFGFEQVGLCVMVAE